MKAQVELKAVVLKGFTYKTFYNNNKIKEVRIMRKKTSGIWLYALFAFMIFVLSGAVSDIAAEDLIVDGTTLVLHGKVEYESVMIVNGGVLYVTPFDGTGDTGMLGAVP